MGSLIRRRGEPVKSYNCMAEGEGHGRFLAKRPPEGQLGPGGGLWLNLVRMKSFRQTQGPSQVTQSPSSERPFLGTKLGEQGSGRKLRVSLLSRLGE